MITKKFFIASASCSALLYCGVMLAQKPVVEYEQQPTVVYVQAPVVNAQQDIVNAYQKVNQAQAANQDQLGSHAQRAMDLLAQADAELRLAANVANAEGR